MVNLKKGRRFGCCLIVNHCLQDLIKNQSMPQGPPVLLLYFEYNLVCIDKTDTNETVN